MKEARVRGLTRSVRIDDLDLHLMKDEIVYLPAITATASKDLRIAQGARAVEVFYVKRSRETRASTVPNLPLSSPPPKEKKALVSPSLKEGFDEERLAEILAKKLAPYVGEKVNTATLEKVQETLSGILSNLTQGFPVRQVPSAGGTVEQVVGVDETPAFIPQGIVGTIDGTVEVKEDETQDMGGVADAAAALKAARRKNKESS